MYHANESKNTGKSFVEGLHVHGNLTFKDNIDYIVKKLIRFSGLVYKVRHPHPFKSLLLFYIPYAESLIRYRIIVYGSAAKTVFEKIEIAQRRIR